MPMIEIWDGPSVRLSDLLDAISGTDELTWSVMEFWGVAGDEETNLKALEQRARESPTGLELSGDQLRELASKFSQLIDGIIAGYRGDSPTRSVVDLRASCEVVIEAIDSTLWRVYARDPATIDALQRSYEDVRTVVPEIELPPVHEKS